MVMVLIMDSNKIQDFCLLLYLPIFIYKIQYFWKHLMLNFQILKFTLHMKHFTFTIHTFWMEDRTNLTLIISQFREIMRYWIEPRERRMLKVMFTRTFSDKYNKKNWYNYNNWSRCFTDCIKKNYAKIIRRDGNKMVSLAMRL